MDPKPTTMAKMATMVNSRLGRSLSSAAGMPLWVFGVSMRDIGVPSGVCGAGRVPGGCAVVRSVGERGARTYGTRARTRRRWSPLLWDLVPRREVTPDRPGSERCDRGPPQDVADGVLRACGDDGALEDRE